MHIKSSTSKTTDPVNVKEGETAEIKKIHPRMYGIATLDFNTRLIFDVPESNRTDILRAIENAGYSLTYTDTDTVIINAVKKQLQHDA